MLINGHPSSVVCSMGLEQSAVDSVARIVEDFECEGHPIIPHKRVPLGSDFQAELPKTLTTSLERTHESDCELDSPRWLGELVWPIQEIDSTSFENAALRVNHQFPECSCKFQDTMDCVRLHIKQKRETLKAELGDAFLLWGFDDMGEIVTEQWTHADQSAFHELLRRNPSSFWLEVLKYFPTKSMTDCVSYYFNVFVLQRRAIQNRINPTNIDSDDDEMVLESDERDSDSTLESIDDEGRDAISDGEEDNGSSSVIWAGKESLVGKSLQGVEVTKGGFAKAAPSNHERMTLLASKDSSSEDCCGSNNAEDRNQPWELLTWDTKTHENSTRVIEQSEKETWAFPSLRSSRDELISTKGMMEEFFGSEVIEHSK